MASAAMAAGADALRLTMSTERTDDGAEAGVT